MTDPVRVFDLVAPIAPRGQGRPRFDPRSKRAYTPATTRKYVDAIAGAARAQWDDEPLDGPLSITVVADFALPARAKGRTHHIQKPDGSNLLKAVEDALSGIVFRDDAQIVTAKVVKRWAVENAVRITLWSLP